MFSKVFVLKRSNKFVLRFLDGAMISQLIKWSALILVTAAFKPYNISTIAGKLLLTTYLEFACIVQRFIDRRRKEESSPKRKMAGSSKFFFRSTHV